MVNYFWWIKDLGSCNDHHIGNAAQKGVESFDEDVKEVLVNVYFDIGGAKGKGLKKKKNFEALAKKKGRSVVALKKFGWIYQISQLPDIRCSCPKKLDLFGWVLLISCETHWLSGEA